MKSKVYSKSLAFISVKEVPHGFQFEWTSGTKQRSLLTVKFLFYF